MARNGTIRVTMFIAFVAINSLLFQNCESRASAPSSSTNYDAEKLNAELDQAMERWTNAKGENRHYTLKYSPTGHVANAGRDVEVQVEDDTVFSVNLAPMAEGDFSTPDDYVDSTYYKHVTIETLFDEIKASLAQLEEIHPSRECPDGIEIVAKFHPEKGYPTNFYIYCGEGSGFQITALSF